MDRMRYSTIAHQGHRILSPLAPATADAIVDALALAPGAPVLDVGCGKAEMLIRAIERHGATGTGVDPNAAFLADARAQAERRVPPGALELVGGRWEDAAFEPGRFAAALCIGATHAFGHLTDALRELTSCVRPGGRIAAGDGYWKREPDPEYLAVLGSGADELTTHAANLATGVSLGLVPRGSFASTDAEWDAYEHPYAAAVERFAAEHPDDPDRDAMLARIGAWRAAYERWGRDTLGFGVYVYEVPGPAAGMGRAVRTNSVGDW